MARVMATPVLVGEMVRVVPVKDARIVFGEVFYTYRALRPTVLGK